MKQPWTRACGWTFWSESRKGFAGWLCSYWRGCLREDRPNPYWFNHSKASSILEPNPLTGSIKGKENSDPPLTTDKDGRGGLPAGNSDCSKVSLAQESGIVVADVSRTG